MAKPKLVPEAALLLLLLHRLRAAVCLIEVDGASVLQNSLVECFLGDAAFNDGSRGKLSRRLAEAGRAFYCALAGRCRI